MGVDLSTLSVADGQRLLVCIDGDGITDEEHICGTGSGPGLEAVCMAGNSDNYCAGGSDDEV
jgi:hypothetical protein